MEQSPSCEANSALAPPPLWNLKVHYRVHRSPSYHAFISRITYINFNIILPFTSTSCKWVLPFRLKKVSISRLPTRATCSAQPVLLDSIILITFRRQYKLLGPLCYFLQPSVTSSLLGPNTPYAPCPRTPSIWHPILFYLFPIHL
jgi:hypothetical protein